MGRQAAVLIACFDPQSRQTLVQWLGEHSLEPIPFATVGELRELLKQRSVVLVLCEAQLSDGNFRDVLEAVARRGRRIPVVVTSPKSETQEYLAAMQAGAFDFLPYPIQLRDLEWVVGNALHRSMAAAS
ncbi:MAG: response regulator [Acidobacteriia bacterium]|jgi:DNA-binding NtrC family response regulator|nr:response regulator [Terriglobia bacterium]